MIRQTDCCDSSDGQTDRQTVRQAAVIRQTYRCCDPSDRQTDSCCDSSDIQTDGQTVAVTRQTDRQTDGQTVAVIRQTDRQTIRQVDVIPSVHWSKCNARL